MARGFRKNQRVREVPELQSSRPEHIAPFIRTREPHQTTAPSEVVSRRRVGSGKPLQIREHRKKSGSPPDDRGRRSATERTLMIPSFVAQLASAERELARKHGPFSLF